MSFEIIPTELYTVNLYDSAGIFQGELRKWNRLEYHQRISGAWNHQLTFNISPDDSYVSFIRAIQPDWIIIIYRIDPITLIKELVYEGLNQTVMEQAQATGNLIFNIYGVGYTQLLMRRVVVPPTGLSHSTHSGPGESVLKMFVDESMVTPSDTTRVFPGVTIEPDLGRGKYTSYNSRYINLLTVCQYIAENAIIDFGVIGSDPPKTFMVCARPLWGKDRRVGNPDGNAPVIFDYNLNNMDIPILSLNYSEEKNVAYIGGTGEAEDRTIEILINTDALLLSPFARKEAFVEGRQEDTTDGLLSLGAAYLEKNKALKTLTFDTTQHPNLRWLREWSLGDVVNSTYASYVFDKHIVEIKVIVTAASSATSVESISIEMEDYAY
jgi:hypothetical protein